jgi:hypothetical protein
LLAFAIASHPVSAKRCRMTGSPKQSGRPRNDGLDCFRAFAIASELSLLAMTSLPMCSASSNPSALSTLLLVPALYPVDIVLLFGLGLDDVDSFAGLIARIVVVLSSLLLARLLLLRILVVGHVMLLSGITAPNEDSSLVSGGQGTWRIACRANQFDFAAILLRAYRSQSKKRVRENAGFVRLLKLIWVVQSRRGK